MKIALFEPDIPQNTGSIIRLTACLGVELHIIEPCGFILDHKQLQRVAMDYSAKTEIHRHHSWAKFLETMSADTRIILLTTKATMSYTDFTFQKNDILLLGRESCGVPDYVVQASYAQIKIPMHKDARSLNVAMAGGIVLGEALRQTNGFDGEFTND